MYILGNTQQKIGAIDFTVETASQVNAATHNRRQILLSGPRAAFLLLLRLNVWGMATLLSKKAFEVNQSITDSQPNGAKWWDIGAQWRNAWWNLGGDWNGFINAVNAGKNKKFFALTLAPKSIKDKLKSQGINGYGLGVDPATAANITAAAGIIASLTPLILALMNNIKKDVPDETIVLDPSLPTDTAYDDTNTLAGAGIIGVGILAALYFGGILNKK